MKRSLMLVFAFAAIPFSLAVAEPAPGDDRVVADPVILSAWLPWHWRLPSSDRYETYDPSTGQSVPVDEATVRARMERGEWIFDRSANAWLSGPASGLVTKDECEKGGWARLGFGNQGQCVSVVARQR